MDAATDIANTGSAASIAEHKDTVIEAAVETFMATCRVQIEPQGDENLTGEGVIIAIISMVGDVDWSIFLGLPRQTASAMAAAFAGFEIPFDSEDMGDAVGELTNIFAGLIKARLDANGLRAEMSLPSVIRVQSLEVLKQSGIQTIKTCFKSEAGPLWTGITAQGDGAIAA